MSQYAPSLLNTNTKEEYDQNPDKLKRKCRHLQTGTHQLVIYQNIMIAVPDPPENS